MFLLWHPSLTAINLSYTFPILETSATALCGTTGMKARSLTSGKANPKIADMTDSFTPLIQQLHCRARFPCCNLFREIWWGGVSRHAGSRCLFQKTLTVTGTSSDGEVVKGHRLTGKAEASCKNCSTIHCILFPLLDTAISSWVPKKPSKQSRLVAKWKKLKHIACRWYMNLPLISKYLSKFS